MKTNSINRLFALCCIICGLTFLPLTAFADYKEVFSGSKVIDASGTTYTAESGHPALLVSDPGSSYASLNVSLISTLNNGIGARVENQGSMTFNSGTISLTEIGGAAIDLSGSSYATVNNSYIETKANMSNGVRVQNSSTLTLNNTDIIHIGPAAFTIYINDHSSGIVNLNHNTFSGGSGILATGTSTLTITGSNGTVIKSNVNSNLQSTVNITLSGEGSKLIGTFSTLTDGSTGTLNIADGATFGTETKLANNSKLIIKDGGHLQLTTLTLGNGLTLETGAVLDYVADSTLHPDLHGGQFIVNNGILVDFSNLTETGLYTLLDWNGVVASGITADQFNIAGTGVEGTFEVSGQTLTFNATAVPEPSTCILLGAGLGVLLLAAHHHRRRIQS